jgi:hypothetical protein
MTTEQEGRGMADQDRRQGTTAGDDAAAGAGGSDLSGELRRSAGLSPRRDPGDSVPEGVAPEAPAPLTETDRKVLKQLEELPKTQEPGGDPKP